MGENIFQAMSIALIAVVESSRAEMFLTAIFVILGMLLNQYNLVSAISLNNSNKLAIKSNQIAKSFSRKSVSRNLRIFKPVKCPHKFTGEMMRNILRVDAEIRICGSPNHRQSCVSTARQADSSKALKKLSVDPSILDDKERKSVLTQLSRNV